jgi:methyl-accepting chemotaxis protein
VAGAAEELSGAEGAITSLVTDSVRITDNARRCARQTNDKVRQLSDTSSRIGEVIGLINQIAGQTNLLALNATIEAARAGDAGRGFAVVASEVKQLASQTARATGEISDQINAVQESTKFVVGAIDEITSIIEQMGELSSGISHSVSEQMVATSQIAAAAQQIVATVDDVGSNVVHVNQAADETGHAASDVMAAAHVTAERATFLRGQVDTFFTRIRAA